MNPPLGERDRTEMNRADLTAAATISGGKFYTLVDAHRLVEAGEHAVCRRTHDREGEGLQHLRIAVGSSQGDRERAVFR